MKWWFEAYDLDDPGNVRYFNIPTTGADFSDYASGTMDTAGQAERAAQIYAESGTFAGNFRVRLLGTTRGQGTQTEHWNSLLQKVQGRNRYTGMDLPTSVNHSSFVPELSRSKLENIAGAAPTQQEFIEQLPGAATPKELTPGYPFRVPASVAIAGEYDAAIAPMAEFEIGREAAGAPAGRGAGMLGRYSREQFQPFYRAYQAAQGLRGAGLAGYGQDPRTFTEFAAQTTGGEISALAAETLRRYGQLGDQGYFPEDGSREISQEARAFGNPDDRDQIINLMNLFRDSKKAQIGGTAAAWLPSGLDAYNAFMSQGQENYQNVFNFGKRFYQTPYVPTQAGVQYAGA